MSEVIRLGGRREGKTSAAAQIAAPEISVSEATKEALAVMRKQRRNLRGKIDRVNAAASRYERHAQWCRDESLVLLRELRALEGSIAMILSVLK